MRLLLTAVRLSVSGRSGEVRDSNYCPLTGLLTLVGPACAIRVANHAPVVSRGGTTRPYPRWLPDRIRSFHYRLGDRLQLQ